MSSSIEVNQSSSIKRNDSKYRNLEPSTVNAKNITPIKFVEKALYKQQKKVVRGVGISTSVVAVPQLIKRGEQTAKSIWHVLLDSGSDDDMLFVHPRNKEYIPTDVFMTDGHCLTPVNLVAHFKSL